MIEERGVVYFYIELNKWVKQTKPPDLYKHRTDCVHAYDEKIHRVG